MLVFNFNYICYFYGNLAGHVINNQLVATELVVQCRQSQLLTRRNKKNLENREVHSHNTVRFSAHNFIQK